ncbi:cadherin, partial [Marinifilum breve]
GEITILDNTYLDYERNGSHNLTLTVSDGLHTSAEESVFIQMYDENDNAPVIANGQSFNVDENASNSTSVGTVSVTDADLNTHYTDWTITGGNTDGIFAINAASGEISIVDNTNLDFEQTESYTLSITVSDGSNTSLAENIRIDINDLNDNIPVVTANQTFNVDENKAYNTIIGTVMATDNDAGTSFSAWKITAGNTDGIFELNASSGEISIADNTNLDYETTTSYAISLTVSDGTNISASETVNIDVNPINDIAPIITCCQVFDVVENVDNDTRIGKVSASDADAGDDDFYTDWIIVAGNEDGIFKIDENSGEITILDNTYLDYERNGSHNLTLTVSDG